MLGHPEASGVVQTGSSRPQDGLLIQLPPDHLFNVEDYADDDTTGDTSSAMEVTAGCRLEGLGSECDAAADLQSGQQLEQLMIKV